MNYDNSSKLGSDLNAKEIKLVQFAFENDEGTTAKEILRKIQIVHSITATEKFAIDSMAKTIREDWDSITNSLQKSLNQEYQRIKREAEEHQDEGFIQQSVERIEVLKIAAEQARTIKNQRLSDLEKVEIMLGGNKN